MNFYFSCFFVIIYLGTLASSSNAYLYLRRNRAEETTKRTLNGDPGFPIINGLVQVASQTRSGAQWMRRLLKALRKWCISHPLEVKLGKCFASYFSIKIPGLRRYEKITRLIENASRAKYPREVSKKFKIKSKLFSNCRTQARIFKANFRGKFFILLVKDFLSETTNQLKQYRDFILRNDFMACLWDYFWKKFWAWVDSAPDQI